MYINLEQNIPSIANLLGILQQKLPDYSCTLKGERLIIAKKNHFIAAIISVRKKYIKVSGNFPYFWESLLFALIVVGLGIIIPVILYFILLHGKMKKAEKDIFLCLKDEVESRKTRSQKPEV
jgi:hypothetical protein